MRKKCSCCKRALGESPCPGPSHAPITHGICASCSARLTSYNRRTAKQVIDSIPGPILVMDSEGEVKNANSRGMEILGKDYRDIVDRLGGEVLECVYADFPGGCGHSEHCTACTIRNSIEATITHGQSLKNVPAYQYVKTLNGVQRMRVLVSTEKAGRYVLLRIEDIVEDDWGITNLCS